MGVEIIGTLNEAALTCNTSGRAFGPVHRARGARATDELRDFVSQLDTDARVLHSDGALESAYLEWVRGL
jgi:hypothetical protein